MGWRFSGRSAGSRGRFVRAWLAVAVVAAAAWGCPSLPPEPETTLAGGDAGDPRAVPESAEHPPARDTEETAAPLPPETNCDNRIDDDRDGRTDCADSDCAGHWDDLKDPARGTTRVEAGAFFVGCPEVCRDAAMEVFRQVPADDRAAAAFRIDITEVTVAAYRCCVERGDCTAPSCSAGCAGTCNYGQAGRDNHPVNCVSWEQADTFCRKLGKTLCTERQWEKAARGGCDVAEARTGGRPTCEEWSRERSYPWGADLPENCDQATAQGCPEGTPTRSVRAARRTSPYGVFDQAGNVEEWLHDDWQASLDENGPIDDSRGAVRGGHAFDENAVRDGGLVFARRGESKGARLPQLGFRCCAPDRPAP